MLHEFHNDRCRFCGVAIAQSGYSVPCPERRRPSATESKKSLSRKRPTAIRLPPRLHSAEIPQTPPLSADGESRDEETVVTTSSRLRLGALELAMVCGIVSGLAAFLLTLFFNATALERLAVSAIVGVFVGIFAYFSHPSSEATRQDREAQNISDWNEAHRQRRSVNQRAGHGFSSEAGPLWIATTSILWIGGVITCLAFGAWIFAIALIYAWWVLNKDRF